MNSNFTDRCELEFRPRPVQGPRLSAAATAELDEIARSMVEMARDIREQGILGSALGIEDIEPALRPVPPAPPPRSTEVRGDGWPSWRRGDAC